MRTLIVTLLAIVVGSVLLSSWLNRLRQPPYTPTLLIQQVRHMSQLVTLRVPVHTTRVTEIRGYVGGIRAIVIVEGDVEVSIDLGQAAFTSFDPEARYGVLRLPQPTPSRPRLDHQRSRIAHISRLGLWNLIPGEAGEAKLVDQAMREAEQAITEAVNTPGMASQAKLHAEHVLTQFFAKANWNVEVNFFDEAK